MRRMISWIKKKILGNIVKIPKKVVIASCWLSSVMLLIAVGFPYLDKIKIEPLAGLYQTIVGIWPKSIHALPEARILIIVWFLCSLFLCLYKKKFFILSVRSMAPDLEDIDWNNYKRDYRIKHHDIDVVEEMKKENISEAVAIIDSKCNNIMKDKRDAEIGFYGIAHTPILFRMGYLLGDQSNIKIFHKSRMPTSKFKEWSTDKQSFKLEEPVESNETVESEELIVCISTTFPIKENEIIDLQPENKHLLLFKGNTLDFDSITSYEDAGRAREVIMDKVRRLVKKYDIRLIHFVISSSAAFTFFLGMNYSRQHDPDCIVYHYVHQHYPWGIKIKEHAENCFYKVL